MGKVIKKKIAEFEEKQVWQRLDENGNLIGEPKEVNVLAKGISRNGFAITYLAELVRLIETIGNKKMKVVNYILSNMNSMNQLIETTQEIADHCKVSKMTVIETLKLLESVNFIARKTGCVMLSPRIAHKGNAQRERFLLMRFFALSAGDNDKGEFENENECENDEG